mgnify:CR=1 FL=1
MDDDHLRLEHQICFRVYSLEKAIMGAYRPLLENLGITYPQYLVMLVMWEHLELTIGQLCEKLHLDTGTVSPLIKRMEQKSLVSRRRLAKDERTVLVSLTEKGQALRNKAVGVPIAVASCLFPTGDDDQRRLSYEQLKLTLDELLASLQCIK